MIFPVVYLPHFDRKTKMIFPSPSPSSTGSKLLSFSSGGYCRRCGKEHRLGPGNTLEQCRRLMHLFSERTSIDLFSEGRQSDPALSTDWLFGPALGKMFGILECIKPDGTTLFLHAFSGQYNGNWLVPGWVPPIFDVQPFLALSEGVERQIKALGRQIDCEQEHSAQWSALRKERRCLSRQLMSDLHALYHLVNFRGERAGLKEVFLGTTGIPTGTGDCCAPKLLHFAAGNDLRPIGLSEFYWGRQNASGTRHQGTFSPPCMEKCIPILGFMLCGLEG